MFKAVLLVCTQALLVQTISGQYLGGAWGAYDGLWGIGGCGYGVPAIDLAASHGPGLAIASASPFPPVGVSVASENCIGGQLAVAGALPFLGTVGLEGVLPTAGAGAIAYNCGCGGVGITGEDIGVGPLGYGAIGAPWGGYGGYGYGGFY